MTFARRTINDGWSVEPVGEAPSGRLEAVVPGSIHHDLIAGGVIPHPDTPGGEAAQVWVGKTTFRWRRHVAEEPAARSVLFESIDTAATVRFNGEVLGNVRNQFHPHRFDLPSGEGVLEVEIAAPLGELERLVEEYGDRPVNADGAWGIYSLLRKAACSFGWDWGPMCPGAGLLGNVWLEPRDTPRIESVRPLVRTCRAECAEVEVLVETVGGGVVEIVVRSPSGDVLEVVNGWVLIDLPERWWPRGYGDQPLYTVEVTLSTAAGEVDRVSKEIGLRSVELDTAEGAFTFVVNGVPLFARGANWIPEGLFPGTAEPKRIVERIEQAYDANMNMLRVWGGGVYEHDVFYETCDRLGIMVWQDFMFACATYPEEAPFPELIETEVRYQLGRLAAHPSIVLWCGGNENILAWRNWGWREKMDPDQTWGRSYFTDLLPRLCEALDPTRPFLEDSPYSRSVETDPNDPDVGDRHTWDVKLDAIRSLVPRFVSEFGHQGPPSLATVREVMGTCSLATLADRQRAWGGDEAEYLRHLDAWFGPADDEECQLLQTQVLQARATSIAFEWLRANGPRCGGALIWQLNDAWVGHSWSLVDVAGRPKPAYWAARRACAERLLTIQPFDGVVHVVAINDSREVWTGEIVVERVDCAGEVLARETFEVEVPAGTSDRFALDSVVSTPLEPFLTCLSGSFGSERAWWFFAPDKDFDVPVSLFDVRVVEAGLEVCARSLLREVLLADFEGGPMELQSLLPGEKIVIECDRARAETLMAKGVLRVGPKYVATS